MQDVVKSKIPFRLDRLPWSAWHWTVIVGLGITWVLDGLEVTIVGNIAPTLKSPAGLRLSDVQFTSAATAYLIGAAAGALFFGYLTDRLGRKKLFLVTLGWYLVLTAATAFSWNATSFIAFRALTGFGLGGEYAAINSAIDELIPSKRRGAVDLGINGTWWLGTIIASLGSIVLLNPHIVNQTYGWRLAFGLGAILAVSILFVRQNVPESPRWLLTHGRNDEAERVVKKIEERVSASTGKRLPPVGDETVDIDQAHRATLLSILRTMVVSYPLRTFVALTLMCTQAFIYNAFTFTQGLILGTYFRVPDGSIPYFYLPFAVGNLAGPLILGRLFDVVGRRAMIAGSYVASGALLLGTAMLFAHHVLTAVSITACWAIVFFFASAGASAAYLTASEIFPMEARALAIAIVYAVGTLVGGAYAPSFFGGLIATKSIPSIVFGYSIAAAIMIFGGAVEMLFGVNAEQKSLEEIAKPLSAVDSKPSAA